MLHWVYPGVDAICGAGHFFLEILGLMSWRLGYQRITELFLGGNDGVWVVHLSGIR